MTHLPALSKLFAVFGLLAIALAVNACDKPSQAAPATEISQTPAAHPVEVVAAKQDEVLRTIRTTADLKPSVEVRVVPQTTERILSFNFENGDRVSKGQVLARLRADSPEQALAQMDAEIESLDAQVVNQERELARGKELFAGRVITRQALDQLDSVLTASRAKRKSLQANRKQLAINAGHSVIRAPISGVIADKSLETGDLASPQTPLCHIMVLDPLRVKIKVNEVDVPRVELGLTAQVEMDAFPGQHFKGRVSRILPYLDSTTRTATVEISLPNPQREGQDRHLLSPGMFGRAELVIERHPHAILIPQKALMPVESDSRAARVFILDEQGFARERHLRTGLKSDSSLEILDGLKPGEQVVVVGQYGLVDGQKASPKNSSNPEPGA